MSSPVVSICVPTYNYRRYLTDALDSAIGQTYADLEIVVVDNCSDDGTPELMEDYRHRDCRIVFYRNAENIGMTANFNKAMALARGKYIKFLCADDVLAPDCVEKMVAAMEANSAVTLVAGGRRLFGSDGRLSLKANQGGGCVVTSGTRAIAESFFHGNFLGEPTAVMFRRRDAESGFDASYHQAIDVDMWFRLLEKGALAYFREELCGIRQHESTGTVGNLRSGVITAGKVRLFQRYARKPYMRGRLLDKLFWDARMASSVAKQAAAGAPATGTAIDSTYYPSVAKGILLPLARVVSRLSRS